MLFYRTGCALALLLLPGFLWAAETNAVAPTATNAVEEAKAADEGDEAQPGQEDRFARYRTIIERKPFGPEPANFDPDTPGARGGGAGDASDPAAQEAAKAQEEQKIIAAVRVSALNVTPSGKIAVGFTDASKQPTGVYYLKVGETRDGWTVKAADAREMKVTLEKDGVEATLGLGEGSADVAKNDKKGAPSPVTLLARTGHPRADRPAAGGSSIANLRARRALKEAERAEEERRQAAAAEQARAEREKAEADREKAAAEREQQREQLLQIQEELRRQREQKEQERQRQQQEATQAAGDAPEQE